MVTILPHVSNWMFMYKRFLRYMDRGSTYPGFILNVFGNFSMIGALFKLMAWPMQYVAYALVTYLIGVYVLGVIDVRNGVMKREIAMNNAENEDMRLLEIGRAHV